MLSGFWIVFILSACFPSSNAIPWVELVPAKKISPGVFSASRFDRDLLSDAITEHVNAAWILFKRNFSRNYLESDEHNKRYDIFKKRFLEMEEHNRNYRLGLVSYEMGINQFSDRTNEELDRMRCIVRPLRKTWSGSMYIKSSRPLPESVDWRKKNAVTDVKNQGNCGSCWAFSSTGAIEGQYHRETNKLESFSEQQLVDCSSDFDNHACQGGLMDSAFKYVKEAGGLETEKAYPYVSGETGEANPKCLFKKSKAKVRVTSVKDIPQFDADALMHAVAFEGPVSVAINAGLPSFPSYHSGIYSDKDCSGDMESLNHGVLLVGYGTEKGKPYWLIKNSWGELWGDKGYIKILRTSDNMCGVASIPSFPTVEPID